MNSKFLIFSVYLILFVGNTLAQSGGQFAIPQSTIASGGQNSSGGNFSLDGTIGQSIAGNALRGNPFAVTSGFWNFTAFAPTAAGANVSGRVTSDGGKGIRNVALTLTGATTGEVFCARSSFFGVYRFEDIPTGQSYILTVSARHFTFASNTQIITLFGDLTNVNFEGAAQF